MFLFFAASATVLYFAAFRERAPVESAVLTDNLVISSTPAGATLSIDGKPLAVLGKEHLSFRVEPNTEHNLVISKEGYNDFILRFVGPATGTKRIDASLIKSEDSLKTDHESEASSSVVADEGSVPLSDKPPMSVAKKRLLRPVIEKSIQGSKDEGSTKQRKRAQMLDDTVETEPRRKIPLPDDDDVRHVPLVDDVTGGPTL